MRGTGTNDPPLPQLQALQRRLGAGQLQEVAGECLSLLQSFPASAALARLLGIALRDLGRPAQALQLFDQLVQHAPHDFDAHLNRGMTQQALGQLAQAVDSYDRALGLHPACADAWNNRAVALLALERPAEALASCDEAIALSPGSAIAHCNRGNACKDLGRFTAAVDSYREACRLQPSYLQARLNLGHALRDLGQFERARSAYGQALALAPDSADALYGLALLHEFQPGDPLLARLQARATAPDCSEAGRVLLGHALAKAWEDLHEYGKSFDSLKQAQDLRAAQIGYRPDADRRLLARIRQLAYAQLPPGKPTGLPAAVRPVFIVGMPRSGTTLVEQILASHPQVHGAGELAALTTLVRPIMGPRLGGDEARAPRPVGGTEIAQLRAGYLAALGQLAAGKPLVTDKMPLNFRWMGFILAAFPEASVVHVRRDPVATCWSIYRQCFVAGSYPWACRMEDVAQYYRLYDELMVFWEERFPGAIHEVRYERLTQDQDGETRRLLEYCGLSWDPRCLRFHETRRPVATASGLQVRRAMYHGSSCAWLRYRQQVQPLLDGLAGLEEAT